MKRVLSLFFLTFLFSQSSDQIAKMMPDINVVALHEISVSEKQNSIINKSDAINWAKVNNYPIKGSIGSKQYEIKDIINNRPLYFATQNINAAKSISTDKVWPGNSTYSLTGNNIILGEWDGGNVRTSHWLFEYQDQGEGNYRVAVMDSDGSNPNGHATHVAGTMMAKHITWFTDGLCHGMSNDAFVRSYDWINDMGELADEVSNGLLLSNHSYNYLTGWVYNFSENEMWNWLGDPTIDEYEDWHFGYYDNSQSRLVDEIAYLNPYYLNVVSASNQGWDTGPQEGEAYLVDYGNGWEESTENRRADRVFDSLPYGLATAKNNLTIGAIYDIPGGYNNSSDVIMTEFSAWGPTDDGRIKPDLVANGTDLHSADSACDNCWMESSGTSMAAPSVTGSLALIQEHYMNTYGNYLKSSTLKSLVIHTAEEAGEYEGPDYKFGWGLMNTEKAVGLISASQINSNNIIENELLNGDSMIYNVQFDGVNPIRLTLGFTDPPSEPIPGILNNREPLLINDLDIRLINNQNSLIYFPYFLDPDSPESPAQLGDNIVDNIEQIYINNPEGGDYTIQITHKGSLLTPQSYSLIITGLRLLEIQNLDIGDDEDLQNLISHTPNITFNNYDSMGETQTHYHMQISTLSDYSSADMWDTGEVSSSDMVVAYAGNTLIDGTTYYLRARVGSNGFWSAWSNLEFRMSSNPTIPSTEDNIWVKTITDTEDGLSSPWGIGGAANGYRYVADSGANKIFKISLEGDVIDGYGTGQAGYQDGDAAVAMFNSPTDVAIDGSSNLYVVDKGNGLIRKITSSGEVSTLSSPGQFISPTGIGQTYGSDFYIADEGGHKIYKIHRNTGATTTVAGTGTAGYVDGSASTAQFSRPVAITVNNNKIYIVDQDNNVIRKIESENVTTIAGSDQFFELSDIAGPRSGWFYASGAYGVVYQFKIENDEITNLTIIAGQEGELNDIDGMGNEARFIDITGVSTNYTGADRIWVCDNSTGKVKLIYENTSPMTFELLLPSNQSTITTTTPTFSWNQSNDNDTPLDIIKYELTITNLFEGTVTTISDILVTTHVVNVPLNEDTPYRWSVTASDLYGETAESSEEQTFFVNATNDSPALVSIPDKTVDEDQSLSFHLSVNDIDNSSDDLVFTAESQNTDLIPNDSIIFSNTTNYSAEFDGSSGTIEIDNIVIDSTEFTMEGWFKANTLPIGDYYNLLCYGGGYYTEGAIVLTFLKGDNQLHPRVWLGMGGWGYWFAGGNVSLGTWNHLSVIKNGAYYKILLNGSQVAGPFDFPEHTLASNSIFTVGELQDGSEYFDGNIDEVRVWRVARSNESIINQMNLQVIADSLSNLVGLYHFNEGSGSVAVDATGYGNDGSLTDVLWDNDLPYFTNHLSLITLTPSQDAFGSTEIILSVSDGSLTDSDTFTLTVNPIDDAMAIDPSELIPDVFTLHQNFPNPFNPITTLRYDLPSDSAWGGSIQRQKFPLLLK